MSENTISLYNADCYEKIKEIPDNSVDLVIIDPPYLINGGKNGYIIKDDFSNLDVEKIFNSKPVIKEAYKEEVPAIWQKVLEGKL